MYSWRSIHMMANVVSCMCVLYCIVFQDFFEQQARSRQEKDAWRATRNDHKRSSGHGGAKGSKAKRVKVPKLASVKDAERFLPTVAGCHIYHCTTDNRVRQ